jgi:hypothetical protein
MIPYWLKPNKVGVALFIVFVLLIPFIFFGCCLFLFYFLEFFHIFASFAGFSRLLENIAWDWRWHLYVVFSLFAYPISMISGRSIENRRELKKELADKEPTPRNRKLEWLAFIAFLVIIAIPLVLGHFLLSQASYPYRWEPPKYWLLRPIFHLPFYVFIIILSIVLMIMKWNKTFIIFLTTTMLLEKFCAELAFHTIGEVLSWLYHVFVIWLNVIPMILYAVKFKKMAVSIILAIALLLIPYNLFLGYRFIQLQDEAHAIVEYVYKTKVQTGSYPEDLSEYEFKNPHLEKHIQRYESKDNSFRLLYFVGTRGTSHSYSPEGGWFYYPD